MSLTTGLLLLSLFIISPAPDAGASPIAVWQDLLFSTENQSMWGPGQEDLVNETFKVPVINIDSGPQTIGAIANLSTSIPNPVYLGWKVAYDACRLAFSDNVCRNGGTIPIVGNVGGLGNAPAQTLTVSLGKNGLELNFDVDVEVGFSGALVLDGGKVDVTYPTSATLQADKGAYAPGELVTLNLLETVGLPTLSTEFSDLDMSLSAYGNMAIQASVEAYLAGLGGLVDIVDATGAFEQELFGTAIGNSEIDLRIFGEEVLTFDTTGGIGLNVFSVKYPPGSPLQISLADFQIQVPDLDTPPTSTWDGTTLTNTQLPIDRGEATDDLTLIGGGSGFDRTDFAKADVDVDGIISAAMQPPIPLGLHAGIPGVLTVEGNLIDTDLGAFFGIGQALTFNPFLMADLQFSTPVLVETEPGVFGEFSTYQFGVGDPLSFLHPGVGLTIDPVYSLGNTFTNLTEFFISPVFTLAVLQLKLSGIGAGLVGANFDAALVQHVFPLGPPISAAQLGSASPFVLGGFESFSGPSLLLAAHAAPVPEAGTLALLAVGLAGLRCWRGRRSRSVPQSATGGRRG